MLTEELTEAVEVRAGRATVRDCQGRAVLTVAEVRLDGHPPRYFASGLYLGHIDGDSLALRTLYATDLPAAVAEARAMVVRELADHAARMQAAVHELNGGTHVCTGTAPTEELPGVDGRDRDVRQAVVAVDPVAGHEL